MSLDSISGQATVRSFDGPEMKSLPVLVFTHDESTVQVKALSECVFSIICCECGLAFDDSQVSV